MFYRDFMINYNLVFINRILMYKYILKPPDWLYFTNKLNWTSWFKNEMKTDVLCAAPHWLKHIKGPNVLSQTKVMRLAKIVEVDFPDTHAWNIQNINIRIWTPHPEDDNWVIAIYLKETESSSLACTLYVDMYYTYYIFILKYIYLQYFKVISLE